MSFPNFVFVGFMKCGTTSLDAYLKRHPKLVLPKVKETDFFVNKKWNKEVSWYKSLFEKK
jgi:lipid A disaccharide synthetase